MNVGRCSNVLLHARFNCSDVTSLAALFAGAFLGISIEGIDGRG